MNINNILLEFDNDENIQKFLKYKKQITEKFSKKKFDNCDFDTFSKLCKYIDNSKITSVAWERWFAFHLNFDKDIKKYITDGCDYGDFIAPPYIIGNDNIELKISEISGILRGGQFRFYENVPWYIMANSIDQIILMFHKSDLEDEIFNKRSINLTSSQGSGTQKGFSDEQKLKLWKDTFDSKNDRLYGFGISLEKRKYFIDKYSVTIDEIKNWNLFKETRGIDVI